MDKIVSLCKRRGFIFQGSEIYGGFAGFWDYGPYGLALKNNIKNLWWQIFVEEREDIYGMDTSVIMNPRAWEASGHVAGFADQMDNGNKFNVMFKTSVGAGEESIVSYLRPETAGGMFVNFKNIMDSLSPKIPFGLAQVGKAFRNEIAPRDFVFRSREFEQMEVEYFVKPADWEKYFEEWKKIISMWCKIIGLEKSHTHELEVLDKERAHYSKRTIDFEFDYPFGRKELYGLAYRTDFDLKSHSSFSNADLYYYDEETKEKFIPHIIEPSLGVDRTILAVLSEAYKEDEMNEEKRIYLALKPILAPIKVAVFPLLKNKPQLVKKAREIYEDLKKKFKAVEFDDNGNIGKRYRKQDEIGTPFCVTVDFDTLEKDKKVTVRDRDSGKQERIDIDKLITYLSEKISL
ncbi:MAG: glycine--tRNA ligase [Candidatus Zambryskibacteria bacterium]|nr:glycine--tRNA ligase [Candidatus Zambryskibacteria bacterium]